MFCFSTVFLLNVLVLSGIVICTNKSSADLNFFSSRIIECKNQPDDVLNYKLSDFRKRQEKHYKAKLINNILTDNMSDESDESDNSYIDNSQCNISNRNTNLLSQRSSCPWKPIIITREDRWPKLIEHAKCTCKKCSPRSYRRRQLISSYTCFPVSIKEYLLVRDENECDPTGYYKWNEATEYRQVACTCARVKIAYQANQ